jgi:PhnB protein
MQMTAYVSFKGQCEAAFTFYEQCLGGQLGPIFHYGGSPMAGDVPARLARQGDARLGDGG